MVVALMNAIAHQAIMVSTVRWNRMEFQVIDLKYNDNNDGTASSIYHLMKYLLDIFFGFPVRPNICSLLLKCREYNNKIAQLWFLMKQVDLVIHKMFLTNSLVMFS